jgi:hypothetical protein
MVASIFGFLAEDLTETNFVSWFIPILSIPYYYLTIKELPTNDLNPYPSFAIIHNNVAWGMLLTRGSSVIHSSNELNKVTLGYLTIEIRDHN